jgi:hypothetical protein
MEVNERMSEEQAEKSYNRAARYMHAEPGS